MFIKCAIPVFDGLLPEPHNRAVLELLFVMAHWHGLAKLRLHNDLTLEVMDAETVVLGDKLRAFSQKTCPAFDTKELHREFNARIRRQTSARKRSRTANAQDSTPAHNTTTTTEQRQSPRINEARHASTSTRSRQAGRRRKTFNLSTYKLHSHGDYVATIKRYGTTDSYSTEPVHDVINSLL
jgi:hypothetical protein